MVRREMASAVEQFWKAYLKTLPPEFQGKRCFEVFHFGNREEMANRLAALVVKRIKTATSGLLWELEASGKPVVTVGDLSIVTNWDQSPVCVIETIEVKIVPFNRVDAQFVYDEGERDRTMRFWNTNMWEWYTEECRALGRTAVPEMPIVCERFRVVFP
jgi:uncharacterized protein YhfF